VNKGYGWYIPKIYEYDSNQKTPITIDEVTGSFCGEINEMGGETIHGRPLKVVVKLFQMEFYRRQSLPKEEPEHIPKELFRWIELSKMIDCVKEKLLNWALKGYPGKVKEESNGLPKKKQLQS